MERYSRVYASVNLDAVKHNMEEMQAVLPAGVKMIGVLKADGYGHGAVPVGRAIEPYVDGFAVAAAEEALQLIHHGFRKPVLILGPVHSCWYEDLIVNGIRPVLFEKEAAEEFARRARALGKTAPVHLALDTGMSRIGMTPDARSADWVQEVSQLDGIALEGIFTHFATADEADKTKTKEQLGRYRHFMELLSERGVEIPVKHCANSAGILESIGVEFDAVRAGISIYGLYPSADVDKTRVRLEPALELKSRITFIKTIEEGTEVSYGGTFRAPRQMKIATIPVGYGDGYPRNLSGKGWVLIRGKKAPILGRICMDQFMADVSDIPEVCQDDPVTLIGKDGDEKILAEDLAEAGGGFHYEILCNLGKRIPRIYLSGGKIAGRKDYFDDRYEGF